MIIKRDKLKYPFTHNALFVLIFILLTGILHQQTHAQRISVSGTEFRAGANRIWLNGTNTPWNSWNDFGGNYNSAWWNGEMQKLKDNHVNSTRIWATSNGEVGINIDANGYVAGATAQFWSNMDDFMAIAQAKQIYVMVAMISFDHTATYHTNYTRWRAMVNSAVSRQSYIDNYVKQFVNRYKNNPYFFAVDCGNELDWMWDNQGISASNVQDLITRTANVTHANSSVLVCQGLGAGIKYNTNVYGGSGNYLAHTNMDFWNIHYYDWMNTYFSNPFDKSPTDYGLNDKPCIIGESPAKGGAGYTPLQNYQKAFQKGWQGLMPWTSNGVDGNGTMADSKPGLDWIYANYPSLVYPTTSTVSVTGITISPIAILMSPESTQQLTKTVSPSNATNQTVTWSSSNTAVATVNSLGLVTAIAPGSTTITITTQDGGKSAASTITVTKPMVAITDVTVTPASISMAASTTQQLTATVLPSNATNGTVTWSSSNTAVATVTASGLVMGVAAGSATITVTTQDGGETATSTVIITSRSTAGIPEVINNSDARIIYSTTGNSWTISSNASYYEGSEHESNCRGAASLTFIGTSIRLIAMKADWGFEFAKVYIDGVYKQDANFYYPGQLHQQTIFTITGLSSDTHTIKVQNTDCNKYIFIDAFIVNPISASGRLVGDRTAVGEETSSETIGIYPNPTKVSSDLTIKLSESVTRFNAELLNVNGNVLDRREFEGNEGKLPVGSLTNGFYLVKIKHGSSVAYRKVWIQN